ncbi:hypothetical protein [Halorussus marinus]|uniref:hypothetical protein n=1 Tax=Halorussus marinus TaxID=2505976 RepID=UPI001430D562|nr:hypothetical protein [Halorussus marinus]
MKDDRLKDVLLMTIAIQLSVIGTAPADDSLVPLFFVGVLLTLVVVLRESARRAGEYFS